MDLDKLGDKLKRTSHSNRSSESTSSEYCIIEESTNAEVIGDYPQAKIASGCPGFQDDGGHYFDRFREPVDTPIRLRLAPKAIWSNVLSAENNYCGFLVDKTTLQIFEEFDLGHYTIVPASVARGRSETREYFYLFVGTHVGVDSLDFRKSIFTVVDITSEPLFQIEIADQEDFERNVVLARKGELEGAKRFSRIQIDRFVVRKDSLPSSDMFGAGRCLLELFVSGKLRDRLITEGVSGVEFRDNDVLGLQ